jgi:pyruvate kinase
VKVSAPALTDRDKAGLETMLREPVDFVALSFVRSPEDVAALRRFLDEHGRRLPVVAKVEKPEGWEALDGILDESDGVMVARGDLGVEMALEKVPFIQKSIIARARRRGKFCITATQMLESMIDSPMPTRAEVSDVANAIADGTDAVMLSAETSAGRHPLEAVRQMARIAEEAGGLKPPPLPEETDRTHADLIADAACEAAESGSVSAIVVFTLSGGSARLVARYRPPAPIYAFTPKPAVARQLAVVYGVSTIVTPELRSTDDVVTHVDRWLTVSGRLPRNAAVAIVAGFPPGRPGNTNLLRLHRLGS